MEERSPTAQDVLPGPVRWARILVFLLAGLSFAHGLVQLLGIGSAAEATGPLLAAGTSGGAQLMLGLMMRHRGLPVLVTVLAVQAFTIVTVLLTAHQGAMLTHFVLPLAVVVLALSRTSREYYRGS
ncbi:hypothetical protein JCM3263A_22230 [Thermobifida fusca]|jgi:hypothetical protein|uniref:Uncharacterized protein n=2 Tax=Thermobifida fusca TaxID=2021 RepID=A0A9P2WPX7_THEFU|nr:MULTISPECIES: hypothetical protein [Thermobifida]AAZ56991.1 hypothetical protein Tfu_2958 [Thermobifida fusca YX]EOR69903.1 hypothetical protein TM51_15176 [Thermobifida fusca TM51]MBO2530042.1 hypothetical protein [Thermobifida sp.]MDD6790659.1 hypothetical protein [Thermobifida fusca]PPS94926.1 hypothetical protein BH05_04020 [Thermobifida fusca]